MEIFVDKTLINLTGRLGSQHLTVLVEENLEEEMHLPGALEDCFEGIAFQNIFQLSFPSRIICA